LATSRESKAHFGLPWDNRGKCYMDGKRKGREGREREEGRGRKKGGSLLWILDMPLAIWYSDHVESRLAVYM